MNFQASFLDNGRVQTTNDASMGRSRRELSKTAFSLCVPHLFRLGILSQGVCNNASCAVCKLRISHQAAALLSAAGRMHSGVDTAIFAAIKSYYIHSVAYTMAARLCATVVA